MDLETEPTSVRARAYALLWHPSVRGALRRIPGARRLYAGWSRTHPFDRANGVDTSGYVPASEIADDPELAVAISPYGGSQPSIVRRSLEQLPDIGDYGFVDIGCGKGRPLLVASAMPFQRLLGIEISPALGAVAQANAAVIARRFPGRPAIQIEIGDAAAALMPGPRVVCFIYHPFGPSMLTALLGNLERQLQAGLEHVFLVYYNPIHGSVIDSSRRFERWSALTLDYAAAELGYGPDIRDTVVIWQSSPARYPALPGANRPILADKQGLQARVGTSP
jgi:SAM-dependent methyltransferase